MEQCCHLGSNETYVLKVDLLGSDFAGRGVFMSKFIYCLRFDV